MGKEEIVCGLPCRRDLRSGFCKENGVYYSKHKPRSIPDDPYLDLVSYVFSPKNRAAEIALIDSSTNQQISYKELPGKIRCVAAGLYRMGIRQGDVVCIVSPNSIHFPVIFLGILSIGAVATTTNPLNTAAEIIKQTRDSKAKLAFTVPELVERVKPTGLPLVVITQESYKHVADHFITYGELLQCDPCMAPTVKIRQEDTAALLYSSGTTGVSKGVIITHRNIISMVILLLGVIISESNLNAWEMVSLAVLPMFHVYGLAMLVAGMLAVGATCVVMGRFELEEMVRCFEHYKITFVPLVPPIILALTHHYAVVGKYDLTSLRHVGSGAAPLGKQVAQAFANKFPRIQLLQGYGMTETTSATSVTTGEGYKRYGSAGLLLPNIEAKVIDVDNATPLPPNQKGELCVRGPIIMKGYFSNEEATSSTIDREGWLHTGDLCYFDEDGFLYVVDRLKELIKYNAYQVAPAELEAVLLSHPEILDGAVVALPDEEVGEIPLAYVVKKANSLLAEQDVINFVAKQVSHTYDNVEVDDQPQEPRIIYK